MRAALFLVGVLFRLVPMLALYLLWQHGVITEAGMLFGFVATWALGWYLLRP